jgi:hypothetical protein
LGNLRYSWVFFTENCYPYCYFHNLLAIAFFIYSG